MSDEDLAMHETVDDADAPQDAASLLRAAFNKAAQGVEPINIQLYGFGEPATELFTVCRYVSDLKEITEATGAAMQKWAAGPVDRATNVALATLPFLSVGSYAMINGQRHEMPPLGAELYDELFPPKSETEARPGSDEQATWLLFHEESTQLAQAYMQYSRYQRTRGRKAEEDALGE